MEVALDKTPGREGVLGATVHTDRLSYYTRHRIPTPYTLVRLTVSVRSTSTTRITSDLTCAFVASHPLRQRTTSKIASYIVLDSAYVHVPSVFLPLLSCKSLPATSRPSTGEISLRRTSDVLFDIHSTSGICFCPVWWCFDAGLAPNLVPRCGPSVMSRLRPQT